MSETEHVGAGYDRGHPQPFIIRIGDERWRLDRVQVLGLVQALAQFLFQDEVGEPTERHEWTGDPKGDLYDQETGRWLK